MQRVKVALAILLGLVWAASPVCALAGGPARFGAVAFGTKLSDLPGFMKIKTVDGIEFAVDSQEGYTINGRHPLVFYGFVDGRLYAAYVRLDGVISFEAREKRLGARYGRPAVSRDGGTKVLRWRREGVKTKLKYDPAAGTVKMVTYAVAYGKKGIVPVEPQGEEFEAAGQRFDKDKLVRTPSRTPSLPPDKGPSGYSPFDAGVSDPADQTIGR